MARSTLIAAGIFSAAIVAASSASAIYSTSFEPPAYGVGSVATQDGWLNGSSAGASQTVVNDFARTGSQSLFWDNSTLNSFYSVRRVMNGQNGAISAATPLEISIWMNIGTSTTANRLYGIYAMNSSTSTLGGVNLGVTISGDGSVRAGTAWNQTYAGAADYVNAALVGQWFNVALQYDGVGGKVVIRDAGMNELFSESYAAVTLANANGAGLWGINLGSDYFDTVNRAGRAHMDDLTVRLIPTPGALALLGLAGLARARRRRA
ncbi:MAG: hypothetical protein EA379_01745 [Phycisphaerales bacterium]|nr:MAG: hypothetical protein EA379_01745 [Phycisphaerales bacterium]